MTKHAEQLLPIGQRRVGGVPGALRLREILQALLAFTLQAGIAQSAHLAEPRGNPGCGRDDLIDQPALPAYASSSGPGAPRRGRAKALSLLT